MVFADLIRPSLIFDLTINELYAHQQQTARQPSDETIVTNECFPTYTY